VPGFFRRLFHLGTLPVELRSQLEAERMLGDFENLKVDYRFNGHVPGLVAVGQWRGYSGALAFTEQRLVGTLTVLLPGSAGKAVDVPWGTGDKGAVHVTIHPAGVSVAIDLEKVSPGEFTGTQSLEYVCPLPAELLAKLPKLEFGFDIPREYVLRLAGVPVRPKKP
jgi:hypothetical protein